MNKNYINDEGCSKEVVKVHAAVSQAYSRIMGWCNFLGMPCGNCPFSTPPYDVDEGCFVDGVEVCSLDNIILDGDRFKGYKLPKKKIDELADSG